MRSLFATAALAALLLACSPAPSTKAPDAAATTETSAPVAANVPAGAYTLDKAHASLIIRVDHLSYSHFTARFARWDAQMQFDPANPASSSINVTIDPRSIESDNPPAGFLDIMRGKDFLDSAQYREISFRSTNVELTGANAARITGDLTLHGVTKSVTLDATFNGGYPGMELDPHARIGLSARGTFKRSEFNMSYGLPPPGTNMGVGDDVEVIIETEFNGPAWVKPAE